MIQKSSLLLKADKYEMALFIKDKPAWYQYGKPAFYDEVKTGQNASFEKHYFVI